MAADQYGHDFAERAVLDLLLGEGDFRIETLRIADGELQVVALGEHDQLVGLPQFERDRLFQQYVLAGAQAVASDRIVVGFRRRRDVDDRNVVVLDDVLVVERRGGGLGQRLHLGEPVRPDLADVQLVAQRRARQRLGADAAAPAGADHCSFNGFHGIPWIFLMFGVGAGPQETTAQALPATSAACKWSFRSDFAEPRTPSPRTADRPPPVPGRRSHAAGAASPARAPA